MTERLDDLGHHPVYLRRSRDVGELNPYRTVRIGMLIAERRQLYFVTANSANRRASLREYRGRSPADTAARTGNDYNFVPSYLVRFKIPRRVYAPQLTQSIEVNAFNMFI